MIFKRFLFISFLCCFFACQAEPYRESTPEQVQATQTERVVTKALLPVSITAAYFASLATHEYGGHYVTMSLYGMDHLKVDLMPGHDESGNLYFGFTSGHYYGKAPNQDEDLIINTSGPIAQYGGHVLSRELLKEGYIPNILQPTFQWYSLFGRSGFYGEIILGLARAKSSDFGKEPIWYSFLFGGIAVIYDIYDLLFCDNPERYLKSLVGEAFYEPRKKLFGHFDFSFLSERGGGGVLVSAKF